MNTIWRALLVLLALGMSSGVRAEHEEPVVGEQIATATAVCDTVEEAMAILNATRGGGFAAGSEMLRRLNGERNAKGEARCAVTYIEGLVVKLVATVRGLKHPVHGNSEGMVFEVSTEDFGTFHIILFKRVNET